MLTYRRCRYCRDADSAKNVAETWKNEKKRGVSQENCSRKMVTFPTWEPQIFKKVLAAIILLITSLVGFLVQKIYSFTLPVFT